jgi:hypothetical protein
MAHLTDSVMQNSTTQTISMTGTSAATTNGFEFGSTSHAIVEIGSPQPFHMAYGATPTATTSSPYYPAGVIVKKINRGDGVAVIKASGSSDATVTVTLQV